MQFGILLYVQRSFKKIILVCFLLIFFLTVQAQHSFSSLQSIWQYAEAHNTSLLTSKSNVLVSQKNIQQSYASLLPSVTGNAAFTDNIKIQSTLVPYDLFNPSAPAGTFKEVQFMRRYSYNAGITAQWNILNMQSWIAVKMAKLNKELAQTTVNKARTDLFTQIGNAYYTYILLQEAEKISLENVATIDSIYSLTNEKYNNGAISEVTLNTTAINKNEAEKNLLVAQQNKLLQINILKSLLHITATDTLQIEDSLYFSNLPPFADTIFLPDPDEQIAQQQLLLSQSEIKYNKWAFMPTLSAIYQNTAQVATDDFFKFDNKNNLPYQYWGLRLTLPIFTGGSRLHEIQKSKIDADNKQKMFEQAHLQASITNRNLVIQYNTSYAAFEKARQTLALYRSNNFHAERLWNEGMISLDERLKYYNDYLNYQSVYFQTMSDLLIQYYSLQVRKAIF